MVQLDWSDCSLLHQISVVDDSIHAITRKWASHIHVRHCASTVREQYDGCAMKTLSAVVV
jgi:hypothetical protein